MLKASSTTGEYGLSITFFWPKTAESAPLLAGRLQLTATRARRWLPFCLCSPFAQLTALKGLCIRSRFIIERLESLSSCSWQAGCCRSPQTVLVSEGEWSPGVCIVLETAAHDAITLLEALPPLPRVGVGGAWRALPALCVLALLQPCGRPTEAFIHPMSAGSRPRPGTRRAAGAMMMARRRPLGAAALLVVLLLAVAPVRAGASICRVCDFGWSVRLSMGGAGGAPPWVAAAAADVAAPRKWVYHHHVNTPHVLLPAAEKCGPKAGNAKCRLATDCCSIYVSGKHHACARAPVGGTGGPPAQLPLGAGYGALWRVVVA